MLIRRRGLLLLGAFALALPVGYANRYRMFAADYDGLMLDPPEAHRLALARRITLVDIRRPDEWALTGVGEGAQPLDMLRDDFETALAGMVQNDRLAPIALICARGVRSARLGKRLTDAGFSDVRNVPEGMLGSGAGPGWIKRGLPLVRG